MWTKAITKSQGNEEQARYRYVELKVESLKKGLKYQNKQELITKATTYGKKGGKAIGIVIAIYLFIVLIFLIIYVFPNL